MYLTLGKYEVRQKRQDTPVEVHAVTPNLAHAREVAAALSATDNGTAYVLDTFKVWKLGPNLWPTIVARYRGARLCPAEFPGPGEKPSLA